MIYFYFDQHNPIYLLTVFAKNERSDLSAAQRNTLSKAIVRLKAEMRGH